MNSDTRASWDIKDEEICRELISFMGLQPSESSHLASLKAKAEEAAPALREEFVRTIISHPNTKEYYDQIPDKAAIDKMFCAWFADLFCGVYDEDYARRRIKIGKTHVRIGLPVRYPIAMVEIVLKHGEKVCAAASDPAAALAAFRKVLALDVAIFNQAYENNQLEHLSAVVGGERLARRLLMGLQ